MKRTYRVEIDLRDFQMLEMYQIGLEQNFDGTQTEVDEVIHDMLWQVITQEQDRLRENYE
jgi:hypothetical protein